MALTPEERVKLLTERLRKLALEVGAESDRLDRKGQNEIRTFRVLSSIFAVLGVAAPTILAFSKNTPDSAWVWVGIVLAASTGAWTAVQAINRWAERYKSSFTASHQLRLLAMECDILSDDVASGGDPMEDYRRVKNKLEDAPKRYAHIRQALVDAQLALVDRAMEETKALPASTEPTS